MTHDPGRKIYKVWSYMIITAYSLYAVGGVAVVERRSLAGELSLSCARPAADG